MTNQAIEKLCFMLLLAAPAFAAHDIYFWIGTVIVVMAAYSLRIMGDIKKKEFTWVSAGIQFVTTVALCSVAYFVWRDAPSIRKFFIFFESWHIYIFLVAFFSFVIVSMGSKVGEDGIVNAALKYLGSIAAEKKETKNNEEPKP